MMFDAVPSPSYSIMTYREKEKIRLRGERRRNKEKFNIHAIIRDAVLATKLDLRNDKRNRLNCMEELEMLKAARQAQRLLPLPLQKKREDSAQ